MAFESTNKSGLNNGRTSRLDISNINQGGLKGETVYTDEELLQLIIDNISKMEVPAGTTDSNKDGKIDVNDLIFNVSEAFKRYAKTQSNKVTLPNLMDALTNGVAILHTDLAVQRKVAEGLQKNIDAANREEKGEKNPLLYSSGTLEQNKLQPIAEVVRATEKGFVEQRRLTGNTTELAHAISNQPGDLATPVGDEYVKHPEMNVKTIAGTVANQWIAIQDLRKTLQEMIGEMDMKVRVARMGDRNTFFIHGPICNALLLVAKSAVPQNSAVRDLWNETGTLFDISKRAFNSNNISPGTELLNETWYCVIGPGNNVIGQYNRVAPHWRNVSSTCPAPTPTYTDPSTLEL